jgi:hypothetical protein
MGVAGFLLLLFLLDLILGFPFGRMSTIVNVVAILACSAVLYMGWDAYQDIR